MSNTKITPTTSKPDVQISSLTDPTSTKITANANELQLLQEDEDHLATANDQVLAAQHTLEKLLSLTQTATNGTITLSSDDMTAVTIALADYTRIKLDHEKLSAQKSNEIISAEIEQRLLNRMKTVLLQTMDKQAVVDMFMAFGANPQSRKTRRKAKRKASMQRTASQVAIAAQHDPELSMALKLFPSDPVKVKEGKRLLSSVQKWSEFEIWNLNALFDNDNVLTTKAIVTTIFEDLLDLTSQMLIPDDVFQRWLNAVCEVYNKVPYHNCLHGADVLQGLNSLMNDSTLKDALTPTLKFAALTAAVVHDIGHPGRNNKFLIDTSHEIALRYNDRSVLENMHIANALKISEQPGCNIFEKMDSPDARKIIRDVWIDMILDTDMARHFTVVKELDTKLKKAAEIGTTFKCVDTANQSFILSILLHCCDLSNPTKPWKTYQKWTARVMEEFHSQAETEVESGRKPSMPRNDANFNLGKFQQGFLRFIRPFFELTTKIEGIDLKVLITNLDKNLQLWDVEIEKASK